MARCTKRLIHFCAVLILACIATDGGWDITSPEASGAAMNPQESRARLARLTRVHYDKIKKLTRSGGSMWGGSNLTQYVARNWPDRSTWNQTPGEIENRRALILALRQYSNELLAAPDYDELNRWEVIHGPLSNTRLLQPFMATAHELSLDGELSEEDLWRLVAFVARGETGEYRFADLEDCFGGTGTRWSEGARAVLGVIARKPLQGEGVRRILGRYLREARADAGKGETPDGLRLALPFPNLFPQPIERLLSLIEGAHVWNARGREDLTAEAAREALDLAGSLSRTFGVPLGESVEAALGAPVNYVCVFLEYPWISYFPTKESRKAARAEHRRPPHTYRWVRSARLEGAKRIKEQRPDKVTRRVGGDDGRWWPAYQGAYLDLGYRWLPGLILEHVRDPARSSELRVWHAGSEDGSQTFLLAALIEEALEILAADPDLDPELEEALGRLEIEIYATDYAYMPKRRLRTYAFDDETTALGGLHHKWNLVAEECTPMKPDLPPTPVYRRSLQRRILEAATPEDRRGILTELADGGAVGGLLGRYLGLDPGVQLLVPKEDRDWGFTKHLYRLIDTTWRIVELDEDGAVRATLNVEAEGRLVRFEMGDMTRDLPRGFEGGGAFDLVVVTNVLPYIYGYYKQQLVPAREEDVMSDEKGEGKTPMELAQNNVLRSLRSKGAVILDELTEVEALSAFRTVPTRHDVKSVKSWTKSWGEWVRSLQGKNASLFLTRTTGLEPVDVKGYRRDLDVLRR